jgi:(p)ppGpp synthase/HD superfamily hydrolase
MHAYAQTNVQLFNQLRSEGYSKEDRGRISEAYEFAMGLFTGLFLPSGKTFIDHLVGTASILASLHVPVNVVAAGLIHAAYLHGDFGVARQGISEVKRKQVRDVVGEEVEEYVARYDRLLWNPQKILFLRDTLDELSPMDRNVLLMRLANELEHHLDLGPLYYDRAEQEQKWRQRYVEIYGPMMVATAEKLGFPSLSAEMTTLFGNIMSAQVPIESRIRSNQHVAYLVVPKSYFEQFWAASYKKLLHAHSWCSQILNRVKRLRWKASKLMSRVLRTAS